MRKRIVIANWKMNPPPKGWDTEPSAYRMRQEIDVVVCPSFTDIAKCEAAGCMVGAQYARPEHHGAFTGDMSIEQIKAAGCRYVLCGHSERRMNHHETDEMVAEQTAAALEAKIHPIVCIGETAEERDKKKTESVLTKQLKNILLLGSELSIAYEPVWAIGTGTAAAPNDVAQAHALIRSMLPKDTRETVRILYGGSVSDTNALALLEQENVDGFLVGTAALDPAKFGRIVDLCLPQ